METKILNAIYVERRGKQAKLHLLAALYTISAVAVSLYVAYAFERSNSLSSLFDLPFEAGATARSLLQGHGLYFLGETGTPGNLVGFRSGRMPVVSAFLALCASVFGPGAILKTEMCKVLLCLFPLCVSAFLALRRFRESIQGMLICTTILFLPFLIPAFLADVANLQVEEGYSFALVALSISVLIFARGVDSSEHPIKDALMMGLLFDLVYLSKSSMIIVTLVLGCVGFFKLTTKSSRLLLVLIIAAAPLGWGTYQRSQGGRFTIGTSLDGANLHKGNNENFLLHYPPPPPGNLDDYESELTQGKVFSNEWEYNDWHKRAAIEFVRSHPNETLIALGRKVQVFFFALTPYGSGPAKLPHFIVWSGLLLFRVLFYSAVGLSLYCIFFRPGSERSTGILFVAVSAACALPYLVGFGYIRHASVLIYPSSLLICRLLPQRLIGDIKPAGVPVTAASACV